MEFLSSIPTPLCTTTKGIRTNTLMVISKADGDDKRPSICCFVPEMILKYEAQPSCLGIVPLALPSLAMGTVPPKWRREVCDEARVLAAWHDAVRGLVLSPPVPWSVVLETQWSMASG